MRADITKREDCDKIVAVAKEHFARAGTLQIDIIVHNAGVVNIAPLEEVTPEEFHRVYSVNVLGPILLTSACKPYLPQDRSGRIVMMSSIHARIGGEHTTVYAGTKSALEAMARVWSRELAERATVNAINPGPVMTDMYLKAPEEMKQALARWNPVTPLVAVRESDSDEVKELGRRLGGRAAYPQEIAGLVASICLPEFGWCTGSVISANGGITFSM